MPKRSHSRQKISFIAKRKVTKPSKVSFTTKTGKKVSFTATKKVSRRVRVTFYKKTKK